METIPAGRGKATRASSTRTAPRWSTRGPSPPAERYILPINGQTGRTTEAHYEIVG